MAKSSAIEIYTANIHKNLLKLQENLFAWAGHALRMTDPYNLETYDGDLKMSNSELFSAFMCKQGPNRTHRTV